MGVEIRLSKACWSINTNENCIIINEKEQIIYNYLFNCAGAYAQQIARSVGIGMEYQILPIKGLYWKLKEDSTLKVPTNIYPVPDLNVPFLGIHLTPSASSNNLVSIGPTAIPVLGRENYSWREKIEPEVFLQMVGVLTGQFIENNGGFRKYIYEQAFMIYKSLIVTEVLKFIPSLQAKDVIMSEKVAIRPQLYNKDSRKLVDDIVCVSNKN